MFRTARFLSFLLLLGTAFGEVPPGVSYDPARHPDPILTYVTNEDFKPTTFAKAEEDARIEILGLSGALATRNSIDIAFLTSAVRRKMKLIPPNIDVIFYPVVRQIYTLKSGEQLVIHSFKFPQVNVDSRMLAQVLNGAAFAKTKKPEDARFGAAPMPEELEVRGLPALLFDDDKQRTLFWVEKGVGHTVTAAVSEQELLRLTADLL